MTRWRLITRDDMANLISNTLGATQSSGEVGLLEWLSERLSIYVRHIIRVIYDRIKFCVYQLSKTYSEYD